MTTTQMHETENDESYYRMCCIGTWLIILFGAAMIVGVCLL